MRRLVKWVGLFVLANMISGAIGFALFLYRFQADIPDANFPAPNSTLEARLQDLDYLRHLPDVDKSFSSGQRREFETEVSALEGRAETITDAAFAMEVARTVAIADNGHTNVNLYEMSDQLSSLPLRFAWFAEGLFVVRATAKHADLLGARVALYDGGAPEDNLARLDPYYGGNAAYLRFQSPLFFANPAAMHAAGLAQNPDQVDLLVEHPDGLQRQITVPAEKKPTRAMRVSRLALPVAAEEEAESGAEWVFLSDKHVGGAQYARQPNDEIWHETLPGGGAYIHMRITMERDGNKFQNRIREFEQKLQNRPADYLVLDLRSNPGGDYMQTRAFARNLVNLVLPEGKVYILSDGGTFSAALVTLAYALEAAGEQAVLVGSGPGDREQFWAESGGRMRLPNSDLSVSIATGYHDWENGCSDWNRCFWPNIFLGAAAGDLSVDIFAPLRFEDYIKGIDTTMQAVFDAQGVKPAPTTGG